MKERIKYEYQFISSTYGQESGDIFKLEEELNISTHQGWEVINHSVYVDNGIKKISVMLKRDVEFDPFKTKK